MIKLNLKCSIRQKKRRNEIKNTKVKYLDLMQRNYNDTNNLNIVLTDVTYISSPKDVIENHVFLSIAIHNKTKKILSWILSKNNDTVLVVNTIKNIDHFKKWIIHLDHGIQYSSFKYIQLTEKLNAKISLSRVGNSLDNREAEYFFSNIKSECLNLCEIEKLLKKLGE